MPDSNGVFIGLVTAADNRAVTIGILDNRSQQIAAESFLIDPTPVNKYMLQTENGVKFARASDLNQVSDFLERHVPIDTPVRLVAEGGRVLPFEEEGGTPAAIYPADSVLFKVLAFIALRGFGVTFAYYEVAETGSVVAHYVRGDPANPSEGVPHQARFVSRWVSGAYCTWMFDVPATPERSALTAALIAKNHGSYYYWSSFAEPPSSGDIVNYLRNGRRKMLVGSPSETFSIQLPVMRDGLEDALENVALEYALAQKQWAELGGTNPDKAALIHVMQVIGGQIRCYSTRADAGERDPRLVYPLPSEDDWIASRIRNLGARVAGDI